MDNDFAADAMTDLYASLSMRVPPRDTLTQIPTFTQNTEKQEEGSDLRSVLLHSVNSSL